jgi:hypothetical protein
MPIAKVHRISASGPDDVEGIAEAIGSGRIDPHGVVAVFGKTEGNGCVNDFSRGFATASLTHLFGRYLPEAEAKRICLVMSGGTEGGMAPHWTVFERCDHIAPGSGRALAIGRAHTDALPFHCLGRRTQTEMVADGVRRAMADADIADAEDVHFVQVKCPLLTVQRAKETLAAGHTVATTDTLKSMALSRAASALGVAIALKEIGANVFQDTDIGSALDLWSGLSYWAMKSSYWEHRQRGPARWRSNMRSCTTPSTLSRYAARLGGSVLPLWDNCCRYSVARSPRCWPKPRPATPACCGHTGIRCWMIPISPRRGTLGPLSAARWPDSSATPKSTYPAAPSTRVRTVADRLP